MLERIVQKAVLVVSEMLDTLTIGSLTYSWSASPASRKIPCSLEGIGQVHVNNLPVKQKRVMPPPLFLVIVLPSGQPVLSGIHVLLRQPVP